MGTSGGVLFSLWLALIASPCAAAQRAQASSPERVVAALLDADWRTARRARADASRLGARCLRPVLKARAGGAATEKLRARLDSVLMEMVSALAEEAVAPLGAPSPWSSAFGALGGLMAGVDPSGLSAKLEALTWGDLGDLGAVGAEQPQGVLAKRRRARRARAALLLVGPAMSGPLLAEPPLREMLQRRALRRLVGVLYRGERERILACQDEAKQRALLASYQGIADLASPIIAAGVRDPDATVRGVFQEVLAQALEGMIRRLDDEDPAIRAVAEAELFRLGLLALPALEPLARAGTQRTTLNLREAAVRLIRRIRFGVSAELVRRIGHDMEGFLDLPYRERRRLVFELERLGGDEAIPALRALLDLDPSLEIQTVAAVGLFRQGDPAGAEWLAIHRAGLSLVRLSKHELAAIHMDQGLKHLTLGNFPLAEEEFKQVLELEPTNEIGHYNLACTYSRWLKLTLAFEALGAAVACGFDDLSHMVKDPDLDPLRDDPRYLSIVEALEAAAEGAPERPQLEQEGEE